MTKTDIKTTIAKECNEAWNTYNLYKEMFGADELVTEKKLTAWVTLHDLYKKLFNENI